VIRVDFDGFDSGWIGLVGLSLDGLMISFSVRVMWLVGWDVLWQVLLLTGFRLLVPCFDFSLESELVFLAERSLLTVPDGLSAPVIRSGNTGKSRFLEANLGAAVPIRFQGPAQVVPRRGDLLQLRFSRNAVAEFVRPHGRSAGRGLL